MLVDSCRACKAADAVAILPPKINESFDFRLPGGVSGELDLIDRMFKVRRVQVPLVRLKYTGQHKQSVTSIAMNYDGRLCATGSADTSIKVLETAKMRTYGAAGGDMSSSKHNINAGTSGSGGAPMSDELRPVLRTYYDHVGTVTGLAFHPRLPILLSSSIDKSIKIYDLTKAQINKKAQFSINDVSPIKCICIHPCGDYVYAGTQHPVIRLYDINTQQCYSSSASSQQQHHTGAITCLSSSSDGSILLSTSVDGSIGLWDGINNKLINKILNAHASYSTNQVIWTRNSKYFLTTGGDHRARLWDIRTGKLVQIYAPSPQSTFCESISATFLCQEKYIAIATQSQSQDVTLMDAETGSIVIPNFQQHTAGNTVRVVCGSPSENTLVTGCDDSKIRYFDIINEEASAMA